MVFQVGFHVLPCSFSGGVDLVSAMKDRLEPERTVPLQQRV